MVQTDSGGENVSTSKDLTKHSAAQKVVDKANARMERIPFRECTYQSEVERANRITEYELLEVERWRTKAELVAKTTAWEYYFNRIRPNSYHQNMTPYQRMKKAGIPSRKAEKMRLWTVPILDDQVFRIIELLKRPSVNHVCKEVPLANVVSVSLA